MTNGTEENKIDPEKCPYSRHCYSKENCPYCGFHMCDPEFVSVGFSSRDVQVTPHHCENCQAIERGGYAKETDKPIEQKTGYFTPANNQGWDSFLAMKRALDSGKTEHLDLLWDGKFKEEDLK